MNELLKKFALPGKFKGDLAETVEPFTDMHAGIFFQYEENSVTFHQYCFRFTLQFSLLHIIFFASLQTQSHCIHTLISQLLI